MRAYFADANIFLRFILSDNIKQASIARKYFSWAKNKQVKLVFISEVIIEIEYVLRKVYKASRNTAYEYLSALVKPTYIAVDKRPVILEALKLYKEISVDLADLILFFTAKHQNGAVLSFDKDLQKIKKQVDK